MQQEEHALSWVHGGAEAEVKTVLTPELQQPGGDKKLYVSVSQRPKRQQRRQGATEWSGDSDGHTRNGGAHGVAVQRGSRCSCSSHIIRGSVGTK